MTVWNTSKVAKIFSSNCIFSFWAVVSSDSKLCSTKQAPYRPKSLLRQTSQWNKSPLLSVSSLKVFSTEIDWFLQHKCWGKSQVGAKTPECGTQQRNSGIRKMLCFSFGEGFTTRAYREQRRQDTNTIWCTFFSFYIMKLVGLINMSWYQTWNLSANLMGKTRQD